MTGDARAYAIGLLAPHMGENGRQIAAELLEHVEAYWSYSSEYRSDAGSYSLPADRFTGTHRRLVLRGPAIEYPPPTIVELPDITPGGTGVERNPVSRHQLTVPRRLATLTNEDLDDLVSEWHDAADIPDHPANGIPLLQWLGMSDEDYSQWVTDPNHRPGK
jgi:hypothetical protein